MDISFFERHPPPASHDPQPHAVGVPQLGVADQDELAAALTGEEAQRVEVGRGAFGTRTADGLPETKTRIAGNLPVPLRGFEPRFPD
jgi:hypothetical protein